MIPDPWRFKPDIDRSRRLQAEAAIRFVIPEARVQQGDDGEVVLTLRKPLVDFFGMRKRRAERRIIARCTIQVPALCEWCPMVRIKWEK